jgi:isopenicillin-N N-acyltransferase-like protein
MHSYPFIRISGSTYFEIGKDYGRQAKDLIAHSVSDYKEVFARTSDRSWEEIQKFAMSFVDITRKEAPEVMEEVEGIAQGSGFSLADIMVVNCRYEITKFPRRNECTTAAVLPEAARDGKMYLVKNWDYRVGIKDHVVILHITQPDGTRIMGLTEAGQVPRGGMNTHGLGMASNNLQSVYDAWDVGLPTVFARRQLLKYKTFGEAESFIRSFPRAVSCNVMVAGFREKKAVDFEVYPKGTDCIPAEQGIVTHANHFVVQPEIHALQRSPRGDRLRELLMEHHGHIDVNTIQCCMADHKNLPQSLCRHSNDPSQPVGMRTITVSSEIMDFEAGIMYVCSGSPCCEEYRAYIL